MAATEQQELGLTQLPEDVLQNVCQQLFDVCLSVQLAVIPGEEKQPKSEVLL